MAWQENRELLAIDLIFETPDRIIEANKEAWILNNEWTETSIERPNFISVVNLTVKVVTAREHFPTEIIYLKPPFKDYLNSYR